MLVLLTPDSFYNVKTCEISIGALKENPDIKKLIHHSPLRTAKDQIECRIIDVHPAVRSHCSHFKAKVHMRTAVMLDCSIKICERQQSSQRTRGSL